MRVLVLLLLCGLAACSSTTAGVGARSDTGTLRIDSSSVAGEVTIENVRKRLVGDRLQGSAVLASRVNSDLYMQYKFTFYDAEGYAMEPETASWRPVNLHGGEQRQVKATAPLAGAVEFEVYVRRVTDE